MNAVWIGLALLVIVVLYKNGNPIGRLFRRRPASAPAHQPRTGTATDEEDEDEPQPFCLSRWINAHPIVTTLLVLGSYAVLVYCLYSKASWGWDIAIILGLWIAAEFGADEETLPKIRHVLLATAAVSIVVLPLQDWLEEKKADNNSVPRVCGDISSTEIRKCHVDTAQSNEFRLESNIGRADPCFFPVPEFEMTHRGGTAYLRISTKKGSTDVSYKAFPVGTNCAEVTL